MRAEAFRICRSRGGSQHHHAELSVRGERDAPYSSFLGMLVGFVVVEDHMHDLAGGKLDLDGVEEANKLLMPMALHVAAE